MRLLPYEDFYIATSLKPDDVQLALGNHVAPGKGIFSPIPYFKGNIVYGSFKITPDIIGRNSFIPNIKGVIEPYLNGSRVHIKMTLHTIVIVILLLMGAVLILEGTIASIKRIDKTQLTYLDYIPFIMVLGIYIMATGIFKSQSYKATTKLLEIFNGDIMESK